MHVQEWLETVPAVSIYLLVGVVIGLESLGIPLPGEIVLVSAALLASQHGEIDPVVLGACASAGAIIGDSIGYAIGRKGGRPLLAWLGGRFPKHFGPAQISVAERSFEKWGMWAVFFGRFVALLRIFAGPLAGVLRMPYWKFLTANVLGGILWAGGTTAVIYSVGVVAEAWLKRFSWLGLLLAVLIGLGSMLILKNRARKAGQQTADSPAADKSAAAAGDTSAPTAAGPVAPAAEPDAVPAAD
ncbi:MULTISPECIES: DedA family protein [unclassified Streptomyces]|uniref:DedA family protein n=1 Tax=Streptomyces TaxID=1883 RepID=UPI0001C198EC|nr:MULTISPECIES: DedA family protein [unclassified Streptomyces]AEN08632.1 SNARE associated Golgi protein-like protein [Streptomyces sp. SirexAA-E]MYR69562.1 DedA family protein [Streptomyces sp. SID4939]MYS01657.1 DedA family protein [Streptomyces sp. SID4940]MYT66223.1 DedA family protein [Streptomyces sp. SID8357]MYT83143.1 DedA family protein [Streptomyces sp. SID8360]